MSELDPNLILLVSDAISRNECRKYEIEHAHTGDKCPAAIAAIEAATPVIAARILRDAADDLRDSLAGPGRVPVLGEPAWGAEWLRHRATHIVDIEASR